MRANESTGNEANIAKQRELSLSSLTICVVPSQERKIQAIEMIFNEGQKQTTATRERWVRNDSRDDNDDGNGNNTQSSTREAQRGDEQVKFREEWMKMEKKAR